MSQKSVTVMLMSCLLAVICLWANQQQAGIEAIATINIFKHRYPFYGGYGYYPYWGGFGGGYGGYGGISIGGGGYGRR